MNRLDRPGLPIFAIGAGAVHLIALALLLPLLITLPGPGSNAPPKPVNIEINLGTSAAPTPVVPDLSASPVSSTEQTAALPPASGAGTETPDVLAGPEAAPVKPKPEAKPAVTQNAKPKVQANAAKTVSKVLRPSSQKKPLFARGRSPLFGGSTAPRSKSQGPSWSALLNAAPSAADAKR